MCEVSLYSLMFDFFFVIIETVKSDFNKKLYFIDVTSYCIILYILYLVKCKLT